MTHSALNDPYNLDGRQTDVGFWVACARVPGKGGGGDPGRRRAMVRQEVGTDDEAVYAFLTTSGELGRRATSYAYGIPPKLCLGVNDHRCVLQGRHLDAISSGSCKPL